MQRTKIEWVKNEDNSQGYTINPVKGLCPMTCSYCYARAMYKRFKWNPEIRFDIGVFSELIGGRRKPSKIFVGSTMELFGDWVNPEWLKVIFNFCSAYPQHTFIFLTKQPEELLKWSPVPENCHIGVSVTNQMMHNRAIACLSGIKSPVKFLSYEPLLSEIRIEGAYDLSEIQWVIIGAQTPASIKTFPKISWVEEIVEACDKAKIPVFLKNNLHQLLPFSDRIFWNENNSLRQEFPVTRFGYKGI